MPASSAAPPIPVLLARQPDYLRPGLDRTVARLLEDLLPDLRPGDRVLVKPNLVSALRGPLACSEPVVVASACAWLLDAGARVLVADSPAFGTAQANARAIGLDAALRPLGLTVRGLGRPRPLRLSFGADIGLSDTARETDLILNAPRLKAHCQMRLTACVKNLFGCVSGMRKAVAHTRFGADPARFAAMIVEVMAALPPAPSLLDAVTAMHVTGPTGGEPIALGWLGASALPTALDTAAYAIVHLQPGDAPLWAELQHRRAPGARPEDLAFPDLAPNDLADNGFQVPGQLDALRFDPLRLLKGAAKRIYRTIRQTTP